MKIGLGLDGRLGLSLDELAELGRTAATLGFDRLWTPSSNLPDSFHICAAWSRATSEVLDGGLETGIAVIPARRAWKPESLASQAATLAQISGNKFVLGIGTGPYADPSWDNMGLPHAPVEVMRGYLIALQMAFSGESVSYKGTGLSVDGFRLSHAVPVPIYLAALGPRMLTLAASLANGASLNWASPAQIAESKEHVATAAHEAGRDEGEVPLSMYIRVCIDEDVDAARRALAMQVLSYAMVRPGADPTMSYRGHFGRMGFDKVLSKVEAKRQAGGSMRDLVDDVPAELLQTVGYFGPPDGAAAAFRQLSAGLDEAIVRVVTARPGTAPVLDAMRALAPHIVRASS